MDNGSKQIRIERVKIPLHEHPLVPFTRFAFSSCLGCRSFADAYTYGGYRCNELGCAAVFHKECAKPVPEINRSFHPNHSLKLIILQDSQEESTCSFCGEKFKVGYSCSICDYNLDLCCARIRHTYESHHTSQHQHQLKSLESRVPHYADKKCLLCEKDFESQGDPFHHCDICNFIICDGCMNNPPPVDVESSTTHEHKLHLVPRRIDFTCDACGELGHRSPYFCLQCNFMIHRECIDLPRVININRHDHRISYIPRLGHGEWKCKVCRKKVDGFYGGYTCIKCPSFVAHSRCAIRDDVWDMRELEGIPEEEDIPPFEVIDVSTIKHFSHEHNLEINKDVHGQVLPENIVCEACLLRILSEPFYSCKQCNFIIHEKCANHPRKKRHVRSNQLFTLHANSRHKVRRCWFCDEWFSGFRYKSCGITLDVRCAAFSDELEHKSHQHPLYYDLNIDSDSKGCSRCHRNWGECFFKCDKDECEYMLEGKCALLPQIVMKKRYDDHPLLLFFGDKDHVDGEYWCEACETKVDPKGWFYTCYDCNTILHIFCVVGDFSYIMPGLVDDFSRILRWGKELSKEVVSNTSICRLLCYVCNYRCKLPTILKLSKAGFDAYICSFKCGEDIIDYD